MSQGNQKRINIEIDDFINSDTKIPDAKILKEDKLLDFAGIRVATIDPRISTKTLQLTQKIKEKIHQITHLS